MIDPNIIHDTTSFALRPPRRPSIGGPEWIAILILIALIFI